MAILRKSDVRKMSRNELAEKIQDLRMELVKSSVTANKSKAKTKELKRALSRCITILSGMKEGTNK